MTTLKETEAGLLHALSIAWNKTRDGDDEVTANTLKIHGIKALNTLVKANEEMRELLTELYMNVPQNFYVSLEFHQKIKSILTKYGEQQ